MEHDELISAEELRNLPIDDDEAFIEVEAKCRRSVAEAVRHDDQHGSYADEMRLQYIHLISALAEKWGIPNLGLPDWADFDHKVYLAYPEFSRRALAEAAKLIVGNRRGKDAQSVQLSSKSRAQIEQELENLRRAVRESHEPDWKKKSLYNALDEFAAHLRNNRRISFGKAMALLAMVAASLPTMVGSSIAGVAEAPTAIANIMRWIGTDKAAEEVEVRRLGAPPKALPAPPALWKAPGSDLDDEIPF